ncbi:hybrid sensor histidine kinase/response regulator [Nitrosovibrio tenuis]|uniref:Virulence sensor protein BvgS n=1 Tax=Nitrosovibrio tenuis TaxID=1233 RepID=A0A1H7I4S7_9PROT|nr:ATP-binding protein [Nitrosovibrio tenuis]SEK57583.1 Signal transduction histidine kinase [Nitrosovibrio tenuis]
MNIKSVTKFSNVALALLLVIIGSLFFHELSIREEINSGERRRYHALMLADELLQSSDDLTRMARTYVITGDRNYKRYFMEVCDIRRGERPRPLNYTLAYWHLMAAGRAPTFEPGERVSMLEMLQRAGFSDEEYALLRKALENSEALVELEKQAFAAAEGFKDDGRGSFTVKVKPDRERAISLLYGERYITRKADIMEPIQKFMDLYNVRMQNELNRRLAQLERQSLIAMGLIFAALLITMGILFYTRMGILQPLAELGRQVAGVTRGTYPSRYGTGPRNEVAKLSEALAVADADKRQLLENERIARTEAERASQLKDEFLATLSHELRTPLNAILGWSQLILSGNMKKEDIQKGLETIERNARAQNKLIEDLLEMSSIISGKVRLDMQQLDAVSLIETAVESVKPTAQAKGIILTKTIDPHAARISGDSNRLQQIFWNLLSNSIKFTPRGGNVDVLVEQSGSFLEIRINDSGLGITPEFMPFVFDRFRQGDASLTRQYGGLGLGLAIVKQLVELHGGIVRAESAGTGKGSSFIVCLPLATVEDNLRNSPATLERDPFNGRAPSFAGLKALVLDDESDARELIKRILIRCEASVSTATSATEGLELLKTERPDVIISDIGMPGKNGYQFIHDVRNLPAKDGGHTPAIALTAFARADDTARALEAGYQIHLSKPVDSFELIRIIADLAGRQYKTDS